MSEDLTKKLPSTDSDRIALILTTVQNLDTRTTNLEKRFDILEQKVDERLYDTRPIWQTVLADIAHLQEGQRRLEETMSSEFGQVNKSLRDIYYRMEVLNDTMLNVQARVRDVDHRVRDLEAQQHKPTNSST